MKMLKNICLGAYLREESHLSALLEKKFKINCFYRRDSMIFKNQIYTGN